jgi:UDP-glucose 4-epimerase
LNLGTGAGASNQEIIDLVAQLVGTVQLTKAPSRPGDPAQLVAGNLMAKTTLGWSPAHSDLKTIIESAWKWYNNLPHVIDKSSK